MGVTEEEATEFFTERLKPMLEESGYRLGKKHDWRKRAIRIGAGQVQVAWASSAKKLRAWPCRYIFGDECGAWPRTLPGYGEPMEYSWKRTRMFRGRRKGIFATTPRETDTPAWEAATAAAFHQWWVPCPHCGQYQYLGWKNVKFDHCRTSDEGWDYDKVRADTFYECEHCNTSIFEHQKAGMIAAGRIQQIDPVTSLPLDVKPRQEVALQIPATYSPVTTWGELAVMFLKAKHRGPNVLRIFVTDELAEPWEDIGGSADLDQLKRCIDVERSQYTLPADELLALTCGVDIQADRMYYVVRAWSYEGRSWLISHGMIPLAEPDGALDVLDHVVIRDYGGVPLSLTLIDSGYRPAAVYWYCHDRRARTGGLVGPVKGQGARRGLPVSWSVLDRTAGGKSLPAGMRLFSVDTPYFKQMILTRMKVGAGEPGEWRLHGDVDDDYLKQMQAEQRVERLKRGMVTYEWVVTGANHYFDCEVYAAAAAWHLQVHRHQRPKTDAGIVTRDSGLAETKRNGRRKTKWKTGGRKGWVRGR